MHSFLLIGQSNMAGRGIPSEVEPINNIDIYVLRNGRWWPMYVPVNCDRRTAGTNLAESFADAYREAHPGVKIGLIPCADGGTEIAQWQPGEVLFDHAVFQAGLAARSSQIMGILWHQGESDLSPEKLAVYKKKCSRTLLSIRKALGEDIPVLMGGLGEFLAKQVDLGSTVCTNYPIMNQIFQEMAQEKPNFGYVDASGLGSNEDNLHFSAPALREFGVRYFNVYKTLTPPAPKAEPVKDATKTTAIEAL